ncbi:GntR family transcriptional regulator [Roseiarcus fermentans]|uniref:GntR family transcriptional regulator n=1 Tax=Roseiarcus fermentans TaxID=1473586 RepID=A0A366FUA8_9HYPH|nr:GntR family transcriptional regulator [Roseiarcus fermentans]RBP17640.1 GntR family transcriptional regulator [Roseiarcus fermentans]
MDIEGRDDAVAHPRRDAKSEAAAERAGMTSPDRVVDSIVRAIRAGVYVPGQRLIEADLTRDYQVSRGPVREALKRLAAEGVLTLTRHRGAYVRALSRAEVHDSLMVLEVLVGLMAKLAAKRIAEGDNADTMREAFRRLLAFRNDGGTAAFLDERRSFYDTILKIGGNHELQRMLPLMQIHLLRMQFQAYITPRDRGKQFAEYQTITDTILSGDGLRAEKVAALHVRRTRLSLMRLPDEAFPAVRATE